MSHDIRLCDLNPVRCKAPSGLKYNHYLEYKNLLLCNLKIVHKDGTPFDYPIETFILNELVEGGQVGYDKVNDIWSQVSGSNPLNEYGLPLRLHFTLGNSKSYNKDASYDKNPRGAYLIKALPDAYPIATLIHNVCTFMDKCDSAIDQNIDAFKTPYIVVCDDKKTLLSVKHAIEQKQSGQPVMVVSSKLGDALKSVDINVDYVADKYEEIKNKRRDQLLNKLGIMSANINKKERVQVGEVNATVGQCLDYIYDLIDTFNKQCETYDIDAVMLDNTSLNEYTEQDADDTAKVGSENE